MAPGYGYRPSNPYQNTSNTGAAQQLAQMSKQLREADTAMRIDQMMKDVHELRYHVDRLESKFDAPIAMYEPEPSIEVVDRNPGWFKKLWRGFITDPFWEFLRRPSL